MSSAPRLMDDGEAPAWNDPEMGKTGSGVADGEECETSLVRVRGSTVAVPPTGDRSKNRG